MLFACWTATSLAMPYSMSLGKRLAQTRKEVFIIDDLYLISATLTELAEERIRGAGESLYHVPITVVLLQLQELNMQWKVCCDIPEVEAYL